MLILIVTDGLWDVAACGFATFDRMEMRTLLFLLNTSVVLIPRVKTRLKASKSKYYYINKYEAAFVSSELRVRTLSHMRVR